MCIRDSKKAKLTLNILCIILRGAGTLIRAVFGALRITHIRVCLGVREMCIRDRHDAVHRDVLTGAHHKDVALLYLLDGDGHLGTICLLYTSRCV